MKNKTVNKKVLRAMSIGLAAMMTVQPILATPVLADETDPVDDAGSSVEATTESSSAETTTESSSTETTTESSSAETTTESSSAETTTESTSAPAPTVKNVTQSYTEASNATGEFKDFLDQAVIVGGDSDELTAANKAVVGTGIGVADAGTLNDNRDDVSEAAITPAEDAKRGDELLENQVNTDINNIKDAEQNLNNAIDAQDKALDELNDKIEITNSFTGTDGLINLETGKIESATSLPAATESLENATEYKKDADEKFEQSKADYDKAAADYEAAKDDLKAKQQAYNKALNDAVADNSDLIKAENELKKAQEDCDNLVTEINQAQEALSKSAIGKLAAAIEKTQNASNDWNALDLIMKDVVKYYYFPSIGIPAADVKIDDQFTKNSALADGTKNERANYIKATVNGKVYYLNYICEKDDTPDNKIDNDGRYPKMVIFEKNPELLGHHYEVEGTDREYKSDDVENNENQVTLEFIKDNTSTDSTGKFIIIGETTYHIDDNDDNKEVTKVEAEDIDDVPNTDAGRNGSYISDVKEEKTTTELKDGVLTVNTEGIITTTTFETGKTLGNIESSESESKSSYDGAVAAAEAARDAAVNNALVAEGHTLQQDENGNDIISSDITVSAKASATATVEYKTKFTTTIDLDGKLSVLYDRADKISKDTEPGEVKNVLDSFVNDIVATLNKDYCNVTVSRSYGIVHNTNYDGFLGWISEVPTDNHYVGTGRVTFTYYSKNNAEETNIAEGTATYKGDVTGNISTSIEAEAKAKAVDNAKVADSPENDTFSEKIDGKQVAASKYEFFGTQYNYAKFTLKDGAVSTTSEVVDTNGEKLDASDAKVNSTDVKYNYKVSNITYADQYDTVLDEQTIYSKNLNVSALTRVDDYAPLSNDNYYNYKHGNSEEGIWADLGDKNSDIYNSLMTDVNNFKKLAEKYADTKTKAIEKVKTAQEKVDALIDSINALKNVSGSEYEKKLAELEAKLAEAQKNLEAATEDKAAVDEAYGRALAAYEDAVARLTPAPATGDEETAPTAGGGTTTAPAPAVVTTLAGTPVFALPAGGVAAPAAGVAGARTSRGAAMDSDSAAADTEDTTAKIAPTKEVEEDALAITKDTIKTIKDNETPLSSLTEDSTQKMNWWWLLLIALLGATGEEIYRRNKKKKEEEAALKAEIDKE